MKISDILKQKKTLSFEIFPPKRAEDTFQLIENTITKLDSLKPDFISVTYGALGNTLNNTVAVAKHIKNNTRTEVLAHLTCVASDKEKINNICEKLSQANIENILALRGDIPQDPKTPIFTDFQYASDMVRHIKKEYGSSFMLAGACYPEKHPESPTIREDIENLKKKQDEGVSFFTTQLFFDNMAFYQFLLSARKAGITIPIIPGIMPISNYNQLDKMIQIAKCNVPIDLRNYFDRYKNDKQALEEIGIVFTSYQILDLIAHDVDGIHLYSMNKSELVTKLMANIEYVASGFFA
ncbi:MAG TPA: methylenetetrahydrofolate reductase [NAD(P)H] [Bacteroidaceae bacterium]|nr:methylenetetrahydrofolate reductase [NAD(P)H] [Bacteroidaceae bacterium]